MVRWFSSPRLELRTERLSLREPTLADWPQWAKVREESRDFLTPWEPRWGAMHLSETGFRERFLKTGDDSRTFFLVRVSDDQLVGGVTISNIRYGVALSASFGYWLGQPFTGQGYMTEAMQRLIRYCFDELYLHRLEAACLPENGPSRRLIRRLGFQEEGLARKYLKINGVWQDHVLHALLRDDPIDGS